MSKSVISIEVETDNDHIPQSITWKATDTTAEAGQKARAMMLSLWDGAERTAMRIDLWTKEMMVDEMTDFFYQTLMTMADTYGRSMNYPDMVDDIKNFARDFYKKFREKQLKENKA